MTTATREKKTVIYGDTRAKKLATYTTFPNCLFTNRKDGFHHELSTRNGI